MLAIIAGEFTTKPRKSFMWRSLPAVGVEHGFYLSGWPVIHLPIPPGGGFRVETLTKADWELLSIRIKTKEMKLLRWSPGAYIFISFSLLLLTSM
jgi:hypothetical protein